MISIFEALLRPQNQYFAHGAVGLGAVLVACALAWLAVTQRRQAGTGGSTFAGLGQSAPRAGTWLILLALAIVVGGALRLHGLGTDTLTHPEVYAPGLPLLEGMTAPPPRHGFVETFRWHVHAEPHPFGYYLAMWAWTKVFGTELWAVRLSSALAGVASIVLVFRIASLNYGRAVGWVAAGMLALNGLHIYWSQFARMYAPGCFLGLLATWLLIEMGLGPRRRNLCEVAYVVTIIAGVSTQLFFWPFFAAHVLWALLVAPGARDGIPRLIYIQTLALVLGSPLLTHGLYQALQAPVARPTLRFLADYFSFGFLLETDYLSEPQRAFPALAVYAVLIFSLALLGRGLFVRPAATPFESPHAAPPVRPLGLAAAGMAVFMAGLAFIAHNRNALLLMVSLVPLLGLGLLPIAALLGPRLREWLAPIRDRFAPASALVASPIPILAVVPTLALFAISFWVSVIASRAFLIFVPYVLILISAGVVALAQRRRVSIPLSLALVAVLLLGTYHFKMTPKSARDYRALVRAIQERSTPDDLVFVLPHDWQTTPISYYLDHSRLVAFDYAAAVAARPEARVWVLFFDERDITDEMARALDGNFQAVDEVTALRAVGRLYVRNAQAASEPLVPDRSHEDAAAGGAYRLSSSSYLDGPFELSKGAEQARDVAVDRAGNAYLVGGTTSSRFPVTEGAFDTTFATGGRSKGQFGDMDVFVTKIDPQGRVQWSTYLGGPNYDRAYAVEVDADGYVYVAGRAGAGFPTTKGVLQPEFAGGAMDPEKGYGLQDGFVSKLTPDGRQLVWSTYFGDAGDGFIRDMDIDGNGDVYVAAAAITRPMAHITPNAYQPNLKGLQDAVFAKLSADGRRVLYATYFGGSDRGDGDGIGPSVRIGRDGEAYLAFGTTTDDVAITPDAYQPQRAGGRDAVLAKFAADGALLFSTYLGGSRDESMETHHLAVDSKGNPIVAGITQSQDFPITPSAYQPNFGDGDPRPWHKSVNGYIAKLSSDGSRLLASTFLGGHEVDGIEGVAVFRDDEIVVTGSTTSADFPITADAFQRRFAGMSDMFVAQLDADLSRIIYSTYVGGGRPDSARCVAVSEDGEIIVGGQTKSARFPLVNAFANRLHGASAAVYLRFTPRPGPDSKS